MVDLVTWGLATGFILKPVVEDFAEDTIKDWLKDIFKGRLSGVIESFKREPLEKAVKKALGKFLTLFQDQLVDAYLMEDCTLEDNEVNQKVKQYIKPLKKFLSFKSVREILGSPFQDNIKIINTTGLDDIWTNNNLLLLPEEFDWNRLARKYVYEVKSLLRDNQELREILDSQNLEKIANNQDIQPDYNLDAYRETLRERYKHLPLDGLDHTIQDRRIPLWDIFVIQNVRQCREYLPKIYEIPKEYQDKLKRSGQLEQEYTLEELERLQKIYASQIAQSVLDVIEEKSSSLTPISERNKKENNYFVILGDPGSGKSTLLKYLAIRWTELPTKELTVKPIPLLIELRDYIQAWRRQECQDFLDFIHKSSGWVGHLNKHDLHETLKIGHALVMFDGLDEVFNLQQRKVIIKQIHDLTQDYPNIQVIVTSRLIGYDHSSLRDANFAHYMIQDLDRIQIEKFSEKWHILTSDTEQDKQYYQNRLKQGIDNFSAIKQLSGNPLLLTMMAILNRSQELPRERAELYYQCSRILLYEFDYKKSLPQDERINYQTLTYNHKAAMCRKIAYFMQSNKAGLAGNIISEEDLETILFDYLQSKCFDHPREIAQLMIHQLRHRNFMLCSLGVIGQEGHYGFVHRTFLEYFCASEFVWRFEKDKTLSLEGLKNEVFNQHWQDESWHEVLRLISGMIEPKFAIKIIEYLMSLDGENNQFINLLLAADCFSELEKSSLFDDISSELQEELKGILRQYQDRIDIYIYEKTAIKLADYWKIDSELISLVQERNDDRMYVTSYRILAKFSITNDEALMTLRRIVNYD